MPSWLITGSNRGIGLALVQHLLESSLDNYVIATGRNISVISLQELTSKYPQDRLQIIQLDVADRVSVDEAVKKLWSLLPEGLDYLVNNAGVHPQPWAKFEDLHRIIVSRELEYTNLKRDYGLFRDELEFSTIVPLRLSRLLLPLTRKSKEKKVIFITSAMGSFERTYPLVDQCNAYSVAKAALNMLAHKWAASLKLEGVTVAIVHPAAHRLHIGWVKTDIGDPLLEWMTKNAPAVKQIDSKDSAAGIVQLAEGWKLEKTGEFMNWDGTSLPW
ncbi:LOW QUALITY PROTEIN: hypothetical protein CVT26_001451 [Gymnopilus dilepis]|uniref:NAD(P)-binding protein n=1 Tax=Gymnopilus dilepis TaxID=231916 RepID=A0A409YUL6_9AGAR|nr:LOW QUALITY PROTEIN: hypothetical protein CVT26_001451 [Gymnopilus dilepis]